MTKPGADDDDKDPLQRALDLGVYAPLGFALEFRRVLPELAEAGRRQVAFSRSLGKAALSSVAKAAASRQATASAPSAAPASPSAEPTPEPADASLKGYDQMTAREVIAALADASTATIEWVRTRELAGKARKTVLAAVERAGS